MLLLRNIGCSGLASPPDKAITGAGQWRSPDHDEEGRTASTKPTLAAIAQLRRLPAGTDRTFQRGQASEVGAAVARSDCKAHASF